MLTAGQKLGVYEIRGPLGAGGMGEVYRAFDPRLHREVAVKILPSTVSGDPDRLARFEREARVRASLNHPHMAAIYGVEEAAGIRALILELVDGSTLGDRLSKGALPAPEAIAIAHQIADPLDAAHEKGIVHRDLKPANGAVPTDILHFAARVVATSAGTIPVILEELSAVRIRPMIVPMPTTARPQRRYDHGLRHLVRRTGDVTVATDLGIHRSTARGWLGAAPTVVVCLDVADLTEPELRQEVLKLRRRVQKLPALLRLALALLRTSGFRLIGARPPDGRAKARILRAVDRAREYLPLRAVLRFLHVSPTRFHAWRGRQRACALEDQSSCPRTRPSRLTPIEVRTIEDMVTSPDYRHVPIGALAVLAQRRDKVWAAPSTWYRLVRQNGWRRPRLRVLPAKPKTGLRTTGASCLMALAMTRNSCACSIRIGGGRDQRRRGRR